MATTGLDAKKYGITEPVTYDGPSREDLKASQEVLTLLKSYNLFETEEGKQRREYVLECLNRLLQQFVRNQAKKSQGIGDNEARNITGKLLTFGSYRLGIVAPDSDIDVLCLCPQCVTRESFFTEFYNMLIADKSISKVQPVPDAYTPVIKLYYLDVPIDLLFASMDIRSVSPNINVLDDNILRNMNDSTVRSVNGCRVASFILDSVPNKTNFRMTLRFIKLWATRRKIYSTVMGFLGGVAYAILTARICQLYPNYVTSQLIEKFFRVYSIWNWKIPVTLCKIKDVPNLVGFMSLKVWDPRSNPHDRQHLMPVITPAFPSMNSTHNVTMTTKRVITEELRRARDILKTQNTPITQLWEQVLEEEDVFSNFIHFLIIEVYGANEYAHGKWEGWIGSRIRFLIKKLENMPNTLIRPLPGFFKFEDEEWSYSSSAFFAFKCVSTDSQKSKTLDIRQSIQSFKDIINGWPDMDNFKDQIKVNIKYLKSSQLPSYVAPTRVKKRPIGELNK